MTDEKTEVLASGDPRAKQQRIGRYRLERRLGAGGMAEVFLARAEGPLGFEKQVVVKRIRPQLASNPRFVEMFLREAKVLASLDHPNIVRIIELDADKGEYFLALEYLEGLSLREVAERHWSVGRPLPIEPLIQIMAEAALGLDHAHRFKDAAGNPQNVIHRDVSPDNLFVTGAGTTKLIDFGIAKKEGLDALTQVGELKGKVPFMSPEHLQGLPLDARADLFSVGVVLYWLLTGRRPFDGLTDVHTMKAILEDPARPVRAMNPRVPVSLEQIVMSLLEKDRDKRMRSAGSLHDALLTLLVGLPRGAPPVRELVAAAQQWAPLEHEVIPVGLAAQPTVAWPERPEDRAGALALDAAASAPTRARVAAVPLHGDRPLPTLGTGEFAPATEIVQVPKKLDISTDEARRTLRDESSGPSPSQVPSDPVIDVERVADVSNQPTLLHRVIDSGDIIASVPAGQREPLRTMAEEAPLESGFDIEAPLGGNTLESAPVVLPSGELSQALGPAPLSEEPPARTSTFLPVAAGIAAALALAVGGAWYGGLFGSSTTGVADAGAVASSGSGVDAGMTGPVLAMERLDAGAAAAAVVVTPPAVVDAGDAAGANDDADAGEEEAIVDVDAGPSEAEPDVDAGQGARRASPPPSRRAVTLLAPPGIQWQGANGEVYGTGNRRVHVGEGARTFYAVDLRRAGRTRVVVDGHTSRFDYRSLPKQMLQIRVRPFAEVFLGRERLGITPLPPVEVVVGTYEVKLVYKKITRVEHVDVKAKQVAALNVVMVK